MIKNKRGVDNIPGHLLSLANFSSIIDTQFHLLPIDTTLFLGLTSSLITLHLHSARKQEGRKTARKIVNKSGSIDAIIIVNIFILYVIAKLIFMCFIKFDSDSFLAGTKLIASLVFFLVIPYYFWSIKVWECFIRTTVLGAIFFGFILLSSGVLTVINDRISGSGLPPVAISVIFVPSIIIPTCMIAFRRNNTNKEKIFLLLSLFISLIVVLMTGTRSGMLAIFTCAIYILIFKKKELLKIKTIFVSFLSFLVVMLMINFIDPERISNLEGNFEFLNSLFKRIDAFVLLINGASKADTSALERLQKYDNAINLFNKSPIFGSNPTQDYPHNIFLELLSQYGLIGFTIFLMLIFFLLKDCILFSWKIKSNFDDKYKLENVTNYDNEMVFFRLSMCMFICMLLIHQISLGIFIGKWLFFSMSQILVISREQNKRNSV